jgi:hypothetical protein
MTTEQMIIAARKKREIEAIAEELGFESAADAAKSLREFGLLDSASVAEPEDEEVKYSMLTRREASSLARKASKRSYSEDRIKTVVRGIGNKYITCAQFSVLIAGVHGIWEDDLFGELVDHIYDLHNYRFIAFEYSHHKSEINQRWKGLYPAMTGQEMIMPTNVGYTVGTLEPIPVPANLAKRTFFRWNKEKSVFGGIMFVIGLVVGALLL